MNKDFWHTKWQKNEIGFHLSDVNPLLVKHFGELNLNQGARLFLPLCGKTRDIAWLLSQGYSVVGAELSEHAIKQLFDDLGLISQVSQRGSMLLYSAADIDIFVGDFFDLSAADIGRVDAVYDRAALVALPQEMRSQYSAQLRKISNMATQLLISYSYDQTVMPGPPFSVTDDEVAQHYQGYYALTLVENNEVVGGLKGKCAATESIWLLKNS